MTDNLALVGTALSLSLTAGLSLYGAAFLTGLAVHLGWVGLAPGWEPLAAVAGLLCAVEFLADKVPWVDSVWDAIHTVIRPIGGALLGLRVLGDLDPAAEVLAFLLLGGAALTAHAAKASMRLVVNTSPEPVSNVLVSLAENGLVTAGVWLALVHPLPALGVGLVALAAAAGLVIWLGARTAGALARLRRRNDRASAGSAPSR